MSLTASQLLGCQRAGGRASRVGATFLGASVVGAPGGEPLGDGARVWKPRSPGSGQLTPLAAARTPSVPVGAATSRDRKPTDRVARHGKTAQSHTGRLRLEPRRHRRGQRCSPLLLAGGSAASSPGLELGGSGEAGRRLGHPRGRGGGVAPGGPSAQRKELRGALPGAPAARASSRWDAGDPGAPRR